LPANAGAPFDFGRPSRWPSAGIFGRRPVVPSSLSEQERPYQRASARRRRTLCLLQNFSASIRREAAELTSSNDRTLDVLFAAH